VNNPYSFIDPDTGPNLDAPCWNEDTPNYEPPDAEPYDPRPYRELAIDDAVWVWLDDPRTANLRFYAGNRRVWANGRTSATIRDSNPPYTIAWPYASVDDPR
jgi:hypothetical protein